jgi:NAD-reducing hydrogenase small subunit
MNRLRLATLWLDGCSGCHMSLLDMDERLLELAARIDVVYSPLVDVKRFPDTVDVVCIEGAVSTSDDETRLRMARQHSGVLIAMGDCAVTGNVPAMRNPQGSEAMLRTVYQERPLLAPRIPDQDLPSLHQAALPLHRFVPVDLFLPGCPPGADAIHATLIGLITGSLTDLQGQTRFGG